MHVIYSFMHERCQYLWSSFPFRFSVNTERQKYSITEAYSILSLLTGDVMLILLTTGWHCVFEEILKLAEIHDHAERVALLQHTHLLACHDGGDPQLLLSYIQGQLVVQLSLVLIQSVEITTRVEPKNI